MSHPINKGTLLAEYQPPPCLCGKFPKSVSLRPVNVAGFGDYAEQAG
jgi:hypothetical protein